MKNDEISAQMFASGWLGTFLFFIVCFFNENFFSASFLQNLILVLAMAWGSVLLVATFYLIISLIFSAIGHTKSKIIKNAVKIILFVFLIILTTYAVTF